MQITPSAPRPRVISGFAISVIVLALIGGGLRLFGLGQRDFWFDESCTFIYVHHLFDWPGGLQHLLVESTNLPYYLLLKGWAAIFGASEAGYRAFSVLAATLGIVATAGLARSLGGRAPGLICALLLVVHPLHIYYAREARAYVLWTLGLAVTLWLLVVAVRRGGWRWYALFGLALWGCLHLHYFTLFLLPALPAIVLLVPRDDTSGWRRRVFRRLMVTLLLVGAGFIPYALLAVLPAAKGGGSAWIAPRFEGLAALGQTLWCFLPAGEYPAHLRGLSLGSPDTIAARPAWWSELSALLAAGLVLAAAALAIRRWMLEKPSAHQVESLDQPRAACVLLILTLVPLLLAWLYSLLIRPIYLPGRYDLIAFPPWIALLAIVLATAFAPSAAQHNPDIASRGTPQRRSIGIGLILLLAACSLVPVERLLSQRPGPSLHRQRAERLATLTDPGDLVLTFSYDRDYLQYYLHRAGFPGLLAAFPSWLERQVGWLDTDADLADDKAVALIEDSRRRTALTLESLSRGRRVFILLDSLDPQGTSRRAAIAQPLITRLREAGCEFLAVDPALGILEIVRTEG